jgi:hypothetical protein
MKTNMETRMDNIEDLKAKEKDRSEYYCFIDGYKRRHAVNIVERIVGAKEGRISRRGPANNSVFRRGNEVENAQ